MNEQLPIQARNKVTKMEGESRALKAGCSAF